MNGGNGRHYSHGGTWSRFTTFSLVAQPGSLQNRPVSVFGTTPTNIPVTDSVILRIHDLPQLQKFIHHAEDAWSPSSPLSLGTQFTTRYGQLCTAIAALPIYVGQFNRQHVLTTES